jgi:8-oxo-dGTP diphosphatase
VLVVRRGPQTVRSGYWAPLSGRLEAGETQAQAVVREVAEEVGLRVAPVAKVWEGPTDDGAFRLHWWTAELLSHELELDTREVSDARWVTAEEFLALEATFPGDRPFFTGVLPSL